MAPVGEGKFDYASGQAMVIPTNQVISFWTGGAGVEEEELPT